MCGISGIINRLDQSVSPIEIKAMNDLVAHRGPDGEGFYHGSNFAFGHRRLSIIDLSSNGHQPMEFQERFVITFNGEIYNYRELKLELTELGYSFFSDSDTEVILAAYAAWGQKSVERFNGMWAFVLYDKFENILFCSRDRFGVKPFYVSQTESEFVFGSEIKQLLPHVNEIEWNQKIILDYLIVGAEDHTNETFFAGVNKLAPAHNLIYDLKSHKYTIEQYFQIQFDSTKNELDESEAVKLFSDLFQDSVKLRMRSDVKVGSCLSGGLDSSSVAAFASKNYQTQSNIKFTAIHAQTSEKQFDESDLAKSVAEHCNLNLEIIQPTNEDFIKSIDEVIYTQEEPFGSPSVFMQYFVLKKARELNCLVMLDGQGGDETLLGYEKYYPAYLMSLKGIRNKWNGFIKASENSSLSRVQLLKYFFYFTKYRIRLRHIKRRCSCLKKELLRGYQSEELRKLSAAYLDIQKLQLFEIQKLPLPQLLRYEDKNSMRNSVETRLPFLDYRVLQTSLSLNSSVKINQGWTKLVLRKSVEKKLPRSIVWRKNKFGFNAPEKSWLSEITAEMKTEINNSEILSHFVDYSCLEFDKLDLRTQWRLFNLARWQKLYNVKPG